LPFLVALGVELSQLGLGGFANEMSLWLPRVSNDGDTNPLHLEAFLTIEYAVSNYLFNFV
jgi:hypothetical protein